jgi:NAD(P)-dependent dehydrogenase (short-subunit alcohol dehydrogenase family)
MFIPRFFGTENGMNVHSPSTRSHPMSHDAKKTILITGATTGIGRHAALYLAERGHRVIATGRNLKALADLGRAASGKLEVLRLDVNDAGSIAAAAAEVDRLTGGRGVDVLVNNAGYGLPGALEEITDGDLRAQFETNVFGLMAVTRAFLPKMRERGEGRVINVSSIGGRVTMPMFGAYHATKYAVEAISDALRMELAPFGIQVALIEPGPIKTEFGARSVNEIAKYRSDASPYAAVYRRADEIAAMADKNSADPVVVSRAIAHAALARRARVRYVAPRALRPVIGLARVLPARLFDWVMTRYLGLTRKRLAAAPVARAAEPAPAAARAA